MLGTSRADYCLEGFDRECNGAFSGLLTDVNLWSKALTEEEMMTYTRCINEGKGDVIEWAEAKWYHTNVRNYEMACISE